MQLDADRLRVVLDHGEVTELDGGALILEAESTDDVTATGTPTF
jgi:hypothetical protein